MIIGNYNVFEADSNCEALKVGDNNILESKGSSLTMLRYESKNENCFNDLFSASVSREVELTNGCVIGAACSLTEAETVSENSIVFGSQCQRREMNDKPYVRLSMIIIIIIMSSRY